ELNHDQLLQYSTLTGERMQCSLYGDHIRIQVEVPRGQMTLGAEITNDLLRQARFDEETVRAELDSAPSRQLNFWNEALSTWQDDFGRVRCSDVLSFYQALFIPKNITVTVGGAFSAVDASPALNITVTVGGAFSAGEASTAFAPYFSDWKDP